ncbi:MAG: ABC transporter permease [bacterium]|nr:ABC transporter permease [bacterium]
MWFRIWTLFKARNKEFVRDRSALGWNILFPFLIIFGFSLVFNQDEQILYKVGMISSSEHTIQQQTKGTAENPLVKKFMETKFIDFVSFESEEIAINKLGHHRLDLLIHPKTGHYWISDSSPKGYIVEKLLMASSSREETFLSRQSISGKEIIYIEWLFPGILGMNIMFSALFGVGYVVVRYRKNGVLKRMSVTPLKPYEFLSAQILSRMFIILLTTVVVYIGCYLMFNFECRGSYISLIFVFALGGFSMISLGLLVASRSSSEEFAGGILNLITWPMMFLSEVWFSLEGANPWVQKFTQIFPLTHMIEGTRKIMNDGAGLMDIKYNVITLITMTFVFLAIGSMMFKWQKDA